MNKVRISAASLAHISLDDKVLVGLNKKRLAAGKQVYTPFGGALEFYESARPFLDSLGAVYEKGNDLRFEIEEDQVPAFSEWFYTQQDRESSPFRELQEELVLEENALPHLHANGVLLNYSHTAEEQSVTDRPGVEGKKTQRFLEIYSAKFDDQYTGMIHEAIQNPASRLGLVTYQEIKDGQTASGIEIASNCLPFLPQAK